MPETKTAYSIGQLLGDLGAAGTYGLLGHTNGRMEAHRAARDAAINDLATGYSSPGGTAEDQLRRLDEIEDIATKSRDALYAGLPRSNSTALTLYDPAQKGNSQAAFLEHQLAGVSALRKGIKSHVAAQPGIAEHHAEQARKLDGYTLPVQAAAGVSSLVPVNDHLWLTPLATMLGGLGTDLAVQHLAPNMSASKRGLLTAGGALAGRLALRGVDALTEKRPAKPRRKEKKMQEKRAYGLGAILGDALAAGTAANHGYNVGNTALQGRKYDSAVRQHQQYIDNANAMPEDSAQYAINRQLAQRVSDKYDLPAGDPRSHAGGHVGTQALSILGGAAPVNDHWALGPAASALGSAGAMALLRHLAPNAGPASTALAAGGGALAGRMGVRGYDALREGLFGKKNTAKKTKKKDDKEKTSSFTAGALQRLAIRLARR